MGMLSVVYIILGGKLSAFPLQIIRSAMCMNQVGRDGKRAGKKIQKYNKSQHCVRYIHPPLITENHFETVLRAFSQLT